VLSGLFIRGAPALRPSAAIIFFFGVALAPLVRENGASTAGQILRRSIKHVSAEAASSFLPFDACNGRKFTKELPFLHVSARPSLAGPCDLERRSPASW
jgi:hypothetical protein